MSGKLPAFMFYPGDWRKDPSVQSLDYETRGIFIEILCVMWECPFRGKLSFDGVTPMAELDLSRLLGLPIDKSSKTLANIVAKCLVKIEQNTGIIYNRRMTDEERIRKMRGEFGALGGAKAQANRKEKVPPSVSVSSSVSSTSSKHTLTKEGIEKFEIPPELKINETEILDWIAYKREKGQGYKPRGLNALWQALIKIPESQRKEAIQRSMSNNWAGIFQLKGENNGKPTGAAPIPGKYSHLS